MLLKKSTLNIFDGRLSPNFQQLELFFIAMIGFLLTEEN